MVVWTNGGSLTNLGLGWVDSEWGLIRFLVVLKILLMVVRGYRLGLDFRWQLFRVWVKFGCDCTNFGSDLVGLWVFLWW